MRYQSSIIGIFLILFGILLYVYWMILPVGEKQRLLEEIYNQTKNQSAPTVEKVEKALDISNIILSADSIRYVIAHNYTLGDYLPIQTIEFENIYIKSNIFFGERSKEIGFYFLSGDGIKLSFTVECKECSLKILLNDDKLLYEGVPEKEFELMILSDYLNKGYNKIKFILVPSKNPFSYSEITLKNIKISIVKKSYIKSVFYYQGGNVYLLYDFCPGNPNALTILVNNYPLFVTSCSSFEFGNKLYITDYLKKGRNIIEIHSDGKIIGNFYLEILQKVFYSEFDLPVHNILHVFVSEGEGIVKINQCTYNIKKGLYSYDISKCVSSRNLLVVEPITYLKIEKIIIE